MMMTARIEIDGLELLALKKLVLINGALAKSLGDRQSGREQLALLRVLIDVVNRADLALASRERQMRGPDMLPGLGGGPVR